MNLGQIRQEIADALSFDPQSSSYESSVIRRINNVYRQLCSGHAWDFLQKTVDYTVMPDLQGAATDPDVAWTAGSYKASLAAFAATYNTYGLEGAVITDPDGVSHTIGVISAEAGGPWVRNWTTSTHTGSAPAVISFERWRLPPDCVDVLGIVNREDQRGPLSAVTQWEEQRRPLYEDQHGTPLAFVLENQTAQEYRTSAEYGGPNNAQLGAEFGQQQFSRPPDVSTVALSAAAGGSLIPNNTYEYMFTWVSAGIETGPSASLSITQTSTQTNFTNTPVIGDPASPLVDFGANKVLYRRRQALKANEAPGAWYRINAGSALGLNSDVTAVSDGVVEQLLVQRYSEPLPAHYFRLYPKPDRVIKLSIRYHYLPPLLEEDRDVPHFPQEFHSLLVHLVVEQIAAQTDGSALAAHHGKMSASLLDKMRRRYLTSRSTNARRGLWGTATSFILKPKIEFGGP